jgi:DNA polymerase-3 subunit delta
MQIKHQSLASCLERNTPSICWLLGQDAYLIAESLKTIKNYIKNHDEYVEQVIIIQSPNDWDSFKMQVNSYMLFSDMSVVHLIDERKSLDAKAKKLIVEYTKAINPRCFVIIRTPNIPQKQLNWLSPLTEVLLVTHYSLNDTAMHRWISDQLKTQGFSFAPLVPQLIQQHTQGNMLACAQTIEKIILSDPDQNHVTVAQVMEHLYNQCDNTLYELVDCCLLGQAAQGIQILRQAASKKTEPTLVLWMLSQELRLILRLIYLIKQNVDFKSALQQLKIWPQRSSLYQQALQRISQDTAEHLIKYCLSIDELIKSNATKHAWDGLEQLILSLRPRRQQPILG